MFREAVVVQRPVKVGQGSLVNAGLKREVRLDRALQAGTRVTVRINDHESSSDPRKTVTG
jgi:hypothetical protein